MVACKDFLAINLGAVNRCSPTTRDGLYVLVFSTSIYSFAMPSIWFSSVFMQYTQQGIDCLRRCGRPAAGAGVSCAQSCPLRARAARQHVECAMHRHVVWAGGTAVLRGSAPGDDLGHSPNGPRDARSTCRCAVDRSREIRMGCINCHGTAPDFHSILAACLCACCFPQQLHKLGHIFGYIFCRTYIWIHIL